MLATPCKSQHSLDSGPRSGPPTSPYTLVPGQGTWLLVDTETGEVEDEFGEYALAQQTLREQLEA